jgi:hypothetical protein
MSDYSGDDITIEEMPQGCVISGRGGTIVVASINDAEALIDSLERMLETLSQESMK